MPYDTWDWDKITGSGTTCVFRPKRIDPILSQDSESGTSSTEPLFTAGYWIFTIQFSLLKPWNYIWLVDWKHSHRGGTPFYIEWPMEMAGVPEGAEQADPGGISPWSSEIDVGAGQGPTFLMYWMSDDIESDRLFGSVNYWSSVTIQLRQTL